MLPMCYLRPGHTAMPTLRLTARSLETLPPAPAGRQVDYFDAGANVPGFGVRLSPNTKRTWFLLYRAHGRLRRLTLGTFPPMPLADAREAGRRALLGVQVDNADPAAAKRARRNTLTFSQLSGHYVEQWARLRKRSWRDDARRLRTICDPRWGSQAVSELTRSDVRKLLGDVVIARGATSANRLHSLLSKLFRWAVAQGYVDANLMSGLPKPAGERSRERVLSDDEIRLLWKRLDEVRLGRSQDTSVATLEPEVALWLQLRLLTAQRGQEVWRDGVGPRRPPQAAVGDPRGLNEEPTTARRAAQPFRSEALKGATSHPALGGSLRAGRRTLP